VRAPLRRLSPRDGGVAASERAACAAPVGRFTGGLFPFAACPAPPATFRNATAVFSAPPERFLSLLRAGDSAAASAPRAGVVRRPGVAAEGAAGRFRPRSSIESLAPLLAGTAGGPAVPAAGLRPAPPGREPFASRGASPAPAVRLAAALGSAS